VIIKEYTVKQFKEKHNKLYNESLKPLSSVIDFTDPEYIIRTLENRGQVIRLELGYASDNWHLA